MSRIAQLKGFSMLLVLYSVVCLILCPILFFNGMFLMNDGVVFSKGVESSLLVKLYLLLMLPNALILFLIHKSYSKSQKIRVMNLVFFAVVTLAFGYFSLNFPFDYIQQFD
ncbi:hypothetical protein IQ283_13330 [Alkalihalobacillus hwajinpoensis]|uniref:hypothetical protein n=1 Tax=Guptibacillus hwajinpoensis TaxID=208199 RepID=UPI001883ECCD|nr:hypothetical protein [Pseudalkalibacillus hwajinpoensis]MBF0707573.1 hypothetical protein [Pseudalkalibacillus hwajinpoensis]